MPRVYNAPSKATLKTNSTKKYRARTRGLSEHLAEHELPSPVDSLAPLTPQDAALAALARDDSPLYDDTFTLRQVALLQAYVACPTDPTSAALDLCLSAGYFPASLEAAQILLRGVLDRVTSLDDMRRAMRISGLGEMWWIRRIFHLMQCGSPRVEAQVAKLAGLALGAFDDPAPAAGAKIIIERVEASPEGLQALTRTTVESSGVVISSDGSLSFPTSAAPKGGQQKNKRRKMLNNMESGG